MNKTKSFNKNTKHKAIYHPLMESILEDEDAMDKGVANKSKKRKPDDADRDEGPPTRSNQGLKRKKTSKDTELSKKAKYSSATESRRNMGNTDEPPVVNADPKDWFKKLERPPTPDPEWNKCKIVDNKPTQKWLNELAKAKKPSKTFDDLMSTCRSYVKLEYNMEDCYKALNDQLDWNNREGDRYPFDLRKPLPLVQSRNHQIVPIDYSFSNDLVYLQGGSTNTTYTTSLTKTKAAKYDMQGIEDMVPNLWSPIKVAYNKHALLGTSHWRSKRQTFYGYVSNRVSKHDVYSTKRIMAMTNVKVNIWYCYGHLKEIEIQRSDQQLYKFMEGDFPRLYLNGIKDMLLLVVKNMLFKLKGEDIMHLALERNRLICSHELYNFGDGTLILVWDKLKDMTNNLEMRFTSVMTRRRWSNLDKKQSRIMVKDIDHLLLEKRLMRSLEKFVGGREYREDLRLLQRTI
ncbi:hypothetical protein Tco_1001024 [Tanacetum coccineum]